eukprot:SAG31_NODE_36781_length_310_cov_0.957346_1_plen_53_part_10
MCRPIYGPRRGGRHSRPDLKFWYGITIDPRQRRGPGSMVHVEEAVAGDPINSD